MEVLITNIWNFSVKIIEGRTLSTWILIYKTNWSGLITTGLVLVSQSSTLSIFFKISFLVLGLCGWWWLGTKATGHQQHQYWLLQFHKWVSLTWTYFRWNWFWLQNYPVILWEITRIFVSDIHYIMGETETTYIIFWHIFGGIHHEFKQHHKICSFQERSKVYYPCFGGSYILLYFK